MFADLLNALDRRHHELGFVLSDFRGAGTEYAYSGQPRALRLGLTIAVR